MRPADLFLSDRPNDSTDAQKSMLYGDHDTDHMVHAPGSSGSGATTNPRFWEIPFNINVDNGDDDDDDDDEAHGAEDSDCRLPDSSMPAGLEPFDTDMSDSDGGVSLGGGGGEGGAAVVSDVLLEDADYDWDEDFDSDEPYQMEEPYSDEDEDSGRDDEWGADEGPEEGELLGHAPSHPTANSIMPLGVNSYAPGPAITLTGPPLEAHTTDQVTVPPTPQSPSMTAFLASLADQAADSLMDPSPPASLVNPGSSIIGSENLGLVDFLRSWAYGQVLYPNIRVPRPNLHDVLRQAGDGIEQVGYGDLRGDGCDFQGLNWESMGTTRETARDRRRCTYKNYVNKLGSDQWSPTTREKLIPIKDNFFRFRRMHIRRDVALAHFQLRSVLACPSRVHAFYPSLHGVNVLNTASRKAELAIDLHEFPGMSMAMISTLDAGCGVLLGGTFSGNYCLKSLDSEDKKNFSEGQISTDISGITNHIRIYRPRRSHGPVAAIASNDHGLRIMDLATEKMLRKTMYPFALNCSAVSPDGRLRALVGDNLDVFITNADTGETLQKLSGHRDYGFACDWSDDGWTVATGFQDRSIRIWDARRWCDASGASRPLCTLRAEMAGVRGLRFSPLGGGRPVLVAAEEADFVNIIDATTFASKQTVDVFGEIGGVAFTNEGRDLSVLCCDTQRGGLLQLERCGAVGGSFSEREQREQQAYIMGSGGGGGGSSGAQHQYHPYQWQGRDPHRPRDRYSYDEDWGARARVPDFWGDMEPF